MGTNQGSLQKFRIGCKCRELKFLIYINFLKCIQISEASKLFKSTGLSQRLPLFSRKIRVSLLRLFPKSSNTLLVFVTRIFCINLVKVLQLICFSITSTTTTTIKTTVLLEGLTILISVLMADILKKFISTAFSGYAVADVVFCYIVVVIFYEKKFVSSSLSRRLMATNLEL
uniref:Uncharacterized protein n=1 Tax=Glossina pallidipes TaxID=7398 RepID=A0A1A9Z808_GLOPL